MQWVSYRFHGAVFFRKSLIYYMNFGVPVEHNVQRHAGSVDGTQAGTESTTQHETSTESEEICSVCLDDMADSQDLR